MPERPSFDTKLYTDAGGEPLSLNDLLERFDRFGSLRVSDLHLKVGCPPTYRRDGGLVPIDGPPLSAETVAAFIAALLTDAELAQLERNGAVDSSHMTDGMQFRLNCFHDIDGLAAAIRALDPHPMPVEEIGFPNGVANDILARQWGLVLVTGITGAGKSTTIASLIDRIAQIRACRIITLEDPVEYRLTSGKAVISQRELGRNVPDFARGLRDCLREDPDVIFVGEMRDRESTAWTLTAAETGHLVFSTLHTRDARGSITRLLDMFPPDQQDEIASQLSLGLSHVICQKLIPRASGKGRVVAMEILNNNYAVSNLIRSRKAEQLYSVMQTRTRDVPEERMLPLERALAQLVAAGEVTALEAQQWANHPSTFQDEIRHLTPPQRRG